MKKIKILGAGPSGLSAAITLAKHGYNIEVYEKNSDVGLRFKGDLQGLENWSEKGDIKNFLNSINIDINFDFDPFNSLRASNGTKEWSFSCEKPAFYLVKRGDVKGSLDNGLKKQALNLGIQIYFNKTISEAEADIIATGPDFKKIFAVDKGIVFETDIENMAAVLINDEVAYKGYSYLLVTKGYGCMCTYLGDDFSKIDACFEATKKMFDSLFNFKVKNPKEVGGVGSFSLKNKFISNGSKVVGEAAGLQDLLWGFGIRHALFSGYLAAISIIENKNYNVLAEKYFKKKLNSSLVNRYFWEKFGAKNYNYIVEKIYRSKYPLKFLYSFHNFNIIQKLFYPVAVNYCKKKYKHLEL